ncbi:MAG: tRNA (adenosine(37)-N6)-dimethylallyltransferase MiaA [Nitrospinae bacterium]|nr:tRNA (adenosine(37)-N6)-dimethylallyltransferase MiaA [Nitrospinota bacterium]
MPPLIILAGPTAVGKSSAALALAERLGTEIVGADSMQVYKGFDIGTAKPSLEARQRIPHHLIDILDPHEEFTAFDFKLRAGEVIRRLIGENKVPILAGGTGLYIKVLVEGFECAVQASPEVRERVKSEILARGTRALHAELARIDPASAEKIKPADSPRIERALSVYRETGRRLSEFHAEDVRPGPEFDARFFLFEGDRKQIYANIDQRVDGMMRMGLLDETKSLLAKGYGKDLKPFKSLGYAQMVNHLEGNISLERAVYEIKRETRHYAKRQITWFKRVPNAVSLPIGETPARLVDRVLSFLPSAAGLALCAVLALHPGSALAHPSTYEDGVRFFEKGDYPKARRHFEVVRRSMPGSREAMRALYLAGKIHSALGEDRLAEESFASALVEYPEIEDYIRFDLAKVYFNLGEYGRSLEQASLLLEKFPGARLLPKAELLRAEVLDKQGKTDDAIRALEQALADLSREPRDPDFVPYIPEIKFKMGNLLETAGRLNEAYAVYRDLYVRFPAIPSAGKIEARLQAMKPDLSPPLSAEELAERAQKLLADVQYRRAADEINRFAKTNGTAPLPDNLRFYLASAYTGLREREAANKVLLDFAGAHPRHPRVLEANYLIARNYWNLDQAERGVSYFKKVLEAGPRTEWGVKSRFYLGKLYEGEGKPELAIKQYAFLTDLKEDHEFKETAAWRPGWIHYRQGDYEKSFERFKNNLERNPNGQLADLNLFWMSKSAEKLGRREEAAKTFLDLYKTYPFTYHGLMAKERLLAGAPGFKDDSALKDSLPLAEENARAHADPDLPREAAPHYLKAREMTVMSLKDNARLEIRRMEKAVKKNLAGSLWLADLYHRAEAYAESFRILDLYRNFKTKRDQRELPVRFWKSLYPLVYPEIIQMSSRNHKIDPFLVKGLIQQESMFEARSLSRAGARGLMQLMPETGKRIALSHEGEREFAADFLYDPETNVKLGVKYLSELAARFGDDPVNVLICYNAGPDVLKRWRDRFRDLKDPDEFLEAIPYQETRVYVKSVMRNYWIYKNLYPEGLGRRNYSDILP